MHTYFENNGIMFRRDATKAEWHMAGTYAKKALIGFPAVGSALIGGSNNAASVAREHLQYLPLDILNKGREQSRKAGLPATLGKRKWGIQALEMEESDDEDGSDKAEDDEDDHDDDNAERPKKGRDITRNLIPKIVVWVYIVDTQYADDTIDGSQPNAWHNGNKIYDTNKFEYDISIAGLPRNLEMQGARIRVQKKTGDMLNIYEWEQNWRV